MTKIEYVEKVARRAAEKAAFEWEVGYRLDVADVFGLICPDRYDPNVVETNAPLVGAAFRLAKGDCFYQNEDGEIKIYFDSPLGKNFNDPTILPDFSGSLRRFIEWLTEGVYDVYNGYIFLGKEDEFWQLVEESWDPVFPGIERPYSI